MKQKTTTWYHIQEFMVKGMLLINNAIKSIMPPQRRNYLVF